MPKVNSVGLKKELHALLKKAATRRGVSMTEYVNDLIEQVGVADKDAKVILSVRSHLTKNN